MIQVKICGVNDAAAFEAAVSAGADWLGLVFFPPSPRCMTPEQAAALVPSGPRHPPLVGLFVDPEPETIARALDAVPLAALQLYGRAIDAAALRARFGVPIWRAVEIAGRADLPDNPLGADRLVIEAKPPEGSTRPGGNARGFDWRLMRGWSAPAPWILAGGLTPHNVDQAIRDTGARAVDVSSGVETSPGVKDPALIRRFIARARGVDAPASP